MNTEIKLRVKNVAELLKILGLNGDTMCQLNLNLCVSKSVIKILDNYSDDWNFIETLTANPQTDSKVQETLEILNSGLGDIECDANLGSCTKSVVEEASDEYEKPIEYYTKELKVDNYNSLATLVEAIFKISKKSPGIKFESGLFFNVLNVEYSNIANSDATIEHSLLAMIIGTYYGDSKMEDAIEDTINKLRGMWISKELSGHPNTTSLTKILYGGK